MRLLKYLFATLIAFTPASAGWLPLSEPSGTPVSNACSTSSGTVITFTAQGTGGANPNRISVVSINWSDSTAAGTAQLNTMTIGGISMTRAVSATTGVTNSNSEIWYVANPTGTTANIIATFATAVNGITIEVYNLVGYSAVLAATTGTTSVSQGFNNKQLALAAASRTVNVSTSLSNITNDFSSACGAGLWGVHASQTLRGNGGTLTSTISPTSNTPKIALAVWASTGFSPVGLTNLIAWYDASVSSSLTISAGNVTAVTDQSGNGNNLVTRFNPPAYSATGLNSLPAMVFGASTTGLQTIGTNTFPLGTGSTITIFAVVKMNSATTFFGRVFSYSISPGSDSNDNAAFYFSRNSNANSFILGRNAASAVAAMDTTIPHRIIATVDSSGIMTLYIDGAATTGSTLLAAWGSPGTLAIGITSYDSSSQFDGPISEVGIATSFTNATNVALLDGYLKSKWGL